MIPIRLIDFPRAPVEDWAFAREMISLDPSVYLPYTTAEDIFSMLSSEVLQMWTLGTEGMVLTRTDLYGEFKVLRILYAFGRMEDLAESVRYFMEQIEVIARTNGTKHIRVECGRVGWSRLLPGYKVEQLVLGKAL